MKRWGIFTFLLLAFLFSLNASADVSDSVHIPEEELSGIELEPTDTLIKMYWDVSLETDLTTKKDYPWFLLIDDTGVWELSLHEGVYYKEEIWEGYAKRYRVLAEYALDPMPLFENIEKEPNFAILETYCFYSPHKIGWGSPGGMIHFVTTQGDYIYYNSLGGAFDDIPNTNGYLFPYEILPQIFEMSELDKICFHYRDAGGTHPYDQVYDLSEYCVHGNESVALHEHLLLFGKLKDVTPDPSQKDFPYALVIGASLAAVTVGGAAIVLVKKKRSKI